jgi:5-(carboxyamino)imidazole ribonucleotide synthase
MANLLGDHLLNVSAEQWRLVFEMPQVHVHMYGKAEARIGRKMGHITAIAGTAADSARIALAARRLLGGG